MRTYVYIMECDGLLKVGIAKAVKARLDAIQSANPHEVRLLHKEQFPEKEAIQNEAYIHRCLKNEGKHIRGEWFRASKSEIITLLDERKFYARTMRKAEEATRNSAPSPASS